MDFDFDMIIAKGAHSDVETPWHQDESYTPVTSTAAKSA